MFAVGTLMREEKYTELMYYCR